MVYSDIESLFLSFVLKLSQIFNKNFRKVEINISRWSNEFSKN